MSNLVKSKSAPSLRSMMEDFWNADKFFEQPFTGHEAPPAVNIRETQKHYEIEMAVPGFKRDDFKIITENGLITISAETSKDKEEKKHNYTRQEFSYSSFTRTFSLPDNVVEDNITAKYNDGMLSIELKKSGKSLTAKKQVKID